jgi:glycerophosphoryl diester phosphodiesterase
MPADPRHTLFGDRPAGALPAVVGHRGAPLQHPENTPASFAAAAAEGATWVELDARLSADGHVVVVHDPHLPDGTPVAGTPLAALRSAGVPSLADVLAGLPPGLGVDVEVKNLPGDPGYDEGMAVVDALGAVVADAGDRPLVISSFNPMVLAAAAERGLDVPLALVTFQVALPAAVEAAVEIGCAGLFPHHSTEGLDGPRAADAVAAVVAAGLACMAWTVDDPEHARRLAAAGVDAICTNDPPAILAALLLR